MIVIVNYGLGNLGTISNKLEKLNIKTKISSEIETIRTADKIILPGVGSFDAGITNLTNLDLVSTIQDLVLKQKIPILGICLGMQLFTLKSEEGNLNGLGFFDFDTIKFKIGEKTGFKIPHMGWNTIKIRQKSPLLEGIPNESRFYFVHSYHVDCSNTENEICSTDFCYDFPSVIQQNSIYGVQFHPERSHRLGQKILENFAEL